MKLLIDLDVIAYRCGFAGEKTVYHFYKEKDCKEVENEEGEKEYIIIKGAEPVHIADNAKDGKAWLKMQEEEGNDVSDLIRVPRKHIDPVENVIHTTKRVMRSIEERFPGSEVSGYFSCSTPDNWRTSFYPEYKANRPDRKPFWYDEVKAWLNKGPWEVIHGTNQEADDLISQEAYLLTEQGKEWVIVSIDKDFHQIPGLHYNWVKEELTEIDETKARQLHAIQCLMGDSVDNIKGIPGWGEVAAQEHLQDCSEGSFDEIVLEGYKTAVDKKGETIYPDEKEAAYWCAVNRALVTLPEDAMHIREMIEEIESAKQSLEEAA